MPVSTRIALMQQCPRVVREFVAHGCTRVAALKEADVLMLVLIPAPIEANVLEAALNLVAVAGLIVLNRIVVHLPKVAQAQDFHAIRGVQGQVVRVIRIAHLVVSDGPRR